MHIKDIYLKNTIKVQIKPKYFNFRNIQKNKKICAIIKIKNFVINEKTNRKKNSHIFW